MEDTRDVLTVRTHSRRRRPYETPGWEGLNGVEVRGNSRRRGGRAGDGQAIADDNGIPNWVLLFGLRPSWDLGWCRAGSWILNRCEAAGVVVREVVVGELKRKARESVNTSKSHSTSTPSPRTTLHRKASGGESS